VYEYSKKYNHLCQYGCYHADTDEKKISLFHQGLSHVLCEHLTLFWGYTRNELVSASIEQEDMCRARLKEERRKRPLSGPNGGAPPKYHLVYTLPLGQPRGPPFVAAVAPASTSAGGPTFSRLPAAGYSTLSSTAGSGRVYVLQLWADWVLLP
jgi:hypothetical protein